LSVAISDDEGKSWKWKKNLENTKGASFSYPSVIQVKDETIHVTYSYFSKEGEKAIKHVSFRENWIVKDINK
jgi:predicted neuraminidase